MDDQVSKVAVIALVLLSFAALYYMVQVATSISLVIRAIIIFVMLILVGFAVQKLLKLKGGYGLYMFGSKKGLATINEIAKRNNVFWDVMAMWGLTLGFGLLTYPLMKGNIDKRVFAFGMVSLVLIMLFVLPNLGTALQFINLPQIQNAVASRSASTQASPSLLSYLVYAVTILAGFSGTLFISLFISTESILWSIILYATKPSAAAATTITNQIGVAPIIPGIDIPFFAGIISLVILLTIHEFSHGVLARKAKVRLKEIGVLVFGSIPIGGYVEPDEKMVEKLDNIKQTKIFSAGVAANFIAMIVFLALMLLVTTYILPTVYHYRIVVVSTLPNYPANGILKNGMQIIAWNNYTIEGNQNNLTIAGSKDKPNGTVSILTNTGLYKIKAVANPSNSSRGVIGVSLGYSYLPIKATPYASFIYFLYTLFALSMLLNFFVGALNLLPLPGLDGWRIYFANIKNEKFIKFLAALIIILIIVNILPVIFYL